LHELRISYANDVCLANAIKIDRFQWLRQSCLPPCGE
jgi:hypothetical protein